MSYAVRVIILSALVIFMYVLGYITGRIEERNEHKD